MDRWFVVLTVMALALISLVSTLVR